MKPMSFAINIENFMAALIGTDFMREFRITIVMELRSNHLVKKLIPRFKPSAYSQRKRKRTSERLGLLG